MTRPWFITRRDPALCERDMARFRDRNPRLFPDFQRTPDLRHGELRLAAEVAIAELRGEHVPTFAHERAFETLQVVALT